MQFLPSFSKLLHKHSKLTAHLQCCPMSITSALSLCSYCSAAHHLCSLNPVTVHFFMHPLSHYVSICIPNLCPVGPTVFPCYPASPITHYKPSPPLSMPYFWSPSAPVYCLHLPDLNRGSCSVGSRGRR